LRKLNVLYISYTEDVWFGMDFRLLQAFLRIAELGSFARAAGVLNQTQPTVSRQMAALERELGSTLFTRHRHGVSLTPAGAVFRDRVQQMLRNLDQATSELTAHSEEPTGTVSVGLPPSLSGPVVKSFIRRHPRVLLHVHETISQGLENLMRNGEADLAVLISDRRLIRNVMLAPLATEPCLLIGPKQPHLASGKPVSVDALAGLPLLMFRPPNYVRLLTETALRKRGLPFKVAVELETLSTAVDLAARGAGYAVVPASSLTLDARRIASAPIRGMAVTWTLAINRHRAAQPAVRALAATVREQARSLIEQGAWKRLLRKPSHDAI
jgi:LysR family nitrogen assimilation transcriptional regulator